MDYFSTSVYSKFDDSPTGFYTIYRSLFDQLREQEDRFRTSYNASRSSSSATVDSDDGVDGVLESVPYTTFGTSTTADASTLHAFYAYWTNYSTAIRFSWVDTYPLSQVSPI
jgi:DnaJ family protein A protein 5